MKKSEKNKRVNMVKLLHHTPGVPKEERPKSEFGYSYSIWFNHHTIEYQNIQKI